MITTATRLSYANGYLELGMLKEAAEELDAIDSSDRLNADVLAMRAKFYLETRNWELMLASSQQLAKNDPEEPFGWVNWAYALRELDRPREARAVALEGLSHHPGFAVLWFNLACYCSLLGEVEDASDHLDKAISLEKTFEKEAVDDPDLANLWTWLRSSENSNG